MIVLGPNQEFAAPIPLKRLIRFDQFAVVAKAAGWTVDRLVEMFPGVNAGGNWSEQTRSYFERIAEMDPSPDTVIPYTKVIDRCLLMVSALAADGKIRVCERCGSIIPARRLMCVHDAICGKLKANAAS